MNSDVFRAVFLLVFTSGPENLAEHFIISSVIMIKIKIIFQESPVSTSSCLIQFTPEATSLHYTPSGMHIVTFYEL